jgi:hypothetical protein
MIDELLKLDRNRMQALIHAASLKLPDCWVAAGFVRNMVWDHLHNAATTPLNDVDVIFFDCTDTDDLIAINAQERLHRLDPRINWEVKNQAHMHKRNNDPPYESSMDAMSYWPEIETAIGVRRTDSGKIELCAPYGVDLLLAGCLTANPKRELKQFKQRVEQKGWLERWPNLKVLPQPASAQDADKLRL